MVDVGRGVESGFISILVIGGLILVIWSKVTGKKIVDIIKELMGNE